jgi:hypothetical protein
MTEAFRFGIGDVRQFKFISHAVFMDEVAENKNWSRLNRNGEDNGRRDGTSTI